MIQDYVLKNYKIDRKKIFLNYRGVSNKDFPFNFKAPKNWLKAWYQKYPQTKNQIILTLPARISRWKGQEDFIELIKKLIINIQMFMDYNRGEERKKTNIRRS